MWKKILIYNLNGNYSIPNMRKHFFSYIFLVDRNVELAGWLEDFVENVGLMRNI